jgi:hypothetical protein
MNWDDAKKASAKLGNGWRLPTKDELNILFKNQDKIDNWTEGEYYWSSTEALVDGESVVWIQFFKSNGDGNGDQSKYPTYYETSARAIRSF